MKQSINPQELANATLQEAIKRSERVLAGAPWTGQAVEFFRADVEHQLPGTVEFNQKLGRNWANLVRLGLHHFRRELFEQDPLWHLRRIATLEDLEPHLLAVLRTAVPEPFEVSVQRDWHPYSAYYLHVTWPVNASSTAAKRPVSDEPVPGYFLG